MVTSRGASGHSASGSWRGALTALTTGADTVIYQPLILAICASNDNLASLVLDRSADRNILPAHAH